jgi:hypothetical protein
MTTDVLTPQLSEVGALVFWSVLAAVIAALFVYLRRRRG